MTVLYMFLSTMTSGGQGPRVKALLRLAVKLKAPRSVNLILEETSSAGPSIKILIIIIVIIQNSFTWLKPGQK